MPPYFARRLWKPASTVPAPQCPLRPGAEPPCGQGRDAGRRCAQAPGSDRAAICVVAGRTRRGAGPAANVARVRLGLMPWSPQAGDLLSGKYEVEMIAEAEMGASVPSGVGSEGGRRNGGTARTPRAEFCSPNAASTSSIRCATWLRSRETPMAQVALAWVATAFVGEFAAAGCQSPRARRGQRGGLG